MEAPFCRILHSISVKNDPSYTRMKKLQPRNANFDVGWSVSMVMKAIKIISLNPMKMSKWSFLFLDGAALESIHLHCEQLKIVSWSENRWRLWTQARGECVSSPHTTTDGADRGEASCCLLFPKNIPPPHLWGAPHNNHWGLGSNEPERSSKSETANSSSLKWFSSRRWAPAPHF